MGGKTYECACVYTDPDSLLTCQCGVRVSKEGAKCSDCASGNHVLG